MKIFLAFLLVLSMTCIKSQNNVSISQDWKNPNNPFGISDAASEIYRSNSKYNSDSATIYPHKKGIEVLDITPFANPSIFDTAIHYYNTGQYDKLLNIGMPKNTKVESDLGLLYLKSIRRIYGNILPYKVERLKVTYADSLIKNQYLVSAAYQIAGSSSAGELSVTFSVSDSLTTLYSFKFTPYDNIQSYTINNIAEKTLEAFRTKNFAELNKQLTVSFNTHIENREAFEKSLSRLNLDSISQFTSRVSIANESMYLTAVYNLPHEKNMLSLTYKLEGTQYKLDDIAYLPKKK